VLSIGATQRKWSQIRSRYYDSVIKRNSMIKTLPKEDRECSTQTVERAKSGISRGEVYALRSALAFCRQPQLPDQAEPVYAPVDIKEDFPRP